MIYSLCILFATFFVSLKAFLLNFSYRLAICRYLLRFIAFLSYLLLSLYIYCLSEHFFAIFYNLSLLLIIHSFCVPFAIPFVSFKAFLPNFPLRLAFCLFSLRFIVTLFYLLLSSYVLLPFRVIFHLLLWFIAFTYD